MSLKKTNGIILKTRRQGETSKILTIYTRDYGKISLVAKGSRSIKSRHWGTLEPFTHIALVFYHKENRDLQFLSQADIVQSFDPVRAQLGKMSLASIMCDLVNRVEVGEAVNPQLFGLLLDSITSLERADNGSRNVIRSFQLKLIGLLGYEPHLSGCRQCGDSESKDLMWFEIESGRYFCQMCSGGTGERMLISSYAIKMMRWLQQAPVTESHKAFVSIKLGREIDRFLQSYMQYHIEDLGNLKSVTFLEEIGNNLKKLNDNGVSDKC